MYRDISDNELIYFVRMKNDYAPNCLVEKYDHYIDYVINRQLDNISSSEHKELKQECKILIYNLVKQYRYDKRCTFLTFITNCMQNMLMSYRAKETRRNTIAPTFSYDMVVNEDGGCMLDYSYGQTDFFNPQLQWRYKDALLALKDLIDSLSEFEIEIWKSMNMKVSYETAAQKLNISRKKYDNERMKLKRKIVEVIINANNN